ncbi:CHASE domain-containing protein [Limnobacter sp.]|uniref:CHASE domain-containing hybrid sensor histidine kinase/response regulator n=1 Tax=Limnobacter sp. TaxID=2003368 RepID=UPI0035178B42
MLVFAVTHHLAVGERQRQTTLVKDSLTTLQGELSNYMVDLMTVYEYGLRGARGAVVARGVNNLSADSFRQYMRTRDLQAEFPGCRGFGFVQYVPKADVEGFLQAAAQDESDPLVIRELSPNTGDRMVIRFIEPANINGNARGLDIASETHRRDAAWRAFKTGQAQLTAPITLVQTPNTPMGGLLFIIPVYREDRFYKPSGDVELEDLVGFAYSPIFVHEALDKLNRYTDRVGFNIQDVTVAGQTKPVFAAGMDATLDTGFESFTEIPLKGRVWRLTVSPQLDYVQSLQGWSQRSIYAVGFAMSLLLALATLLLTRLAQARLENSRKNKNLEKLRVQLSTLNDAVSVAIALIDREGRVVSASKAWHELFDSTGQASNHNQRLFDLTARDNDRRLLQGLFARVMRGEHLDHDFLNLDLPNGDQQSIRMHFTPWMGDKNQIDGCALFVEDIRSFLEYKAHQRSVQSTLELKVQERTSELTKAKRFLTATLDAVPSMICYWSREGFCVFANAASADWYGYSDEELLGASLPDVWGSLYDEPATRAVEGVLQGRAQKLQRTYPPRTLNEPARHALVQLLPDVDRGKVIGFYEVGNDLTVLMSMQQALEQRAQDNRVMVDAIKNSFSYTLTDKDGFFIEVSETFSAEVGYEQIDLLGCSIKKLMPSEVGQMAWDILVSRDKPSGFHQTELHVQCNGDELRVFDVWFIPLSEARTSEWRLLGLWVDVTSKRETQKLLENAKLAAEHANLQKSQFLANMSHELRTPLNSIIGNSYLLRRLLDAHEQLDLVGSIYSSGQHLLTLLNDILDLSKIEAGEMHLEKSEFSLHVLVQEVLEMFSSVAEQKGIDLNAKVDRQSVPDVLVGDETRTKQILINLVGNATKFTNAGQVQVRCTLARQNQKSSGTRIRLEVEDTGPGMLEETRQKLFRPFVQADTSTTRYFGGTGLGLSIVKQLAELMRGEVGVSSALGEGSLFWVEIELEQRGVLQDRSIENVTSSDSVLLRLALFNQTAELKAFASQAATQFGWVVLPEDQQASCDVLIEDSNVSDEEFSQPLDAASAGLKVKINLSQNVCEVGGQSFAMARDLDLFNAIGQAATLKGLPVEWLDQRSVLKEPSMAGLTGVRVCIVDDNPLNLKVASGLLQTEGAKVVATFPDGQAVVDWLCENPGAVDLVFMDIQMPVMDGNQAVALIRKLPGLGQLPVIALTAGALTSEKEEAMKNGMTDYLTKPFNPAQVRKVSRLWAQRGTQQFLPLRHNQAPAKKDRSKQVQS